jgi:hypothetical protein
MRIPTVRSLAARSTLILGLILTVRVTNATTIPASAELGHTDGAGHRPGGSV